MDAIKRAWTAYRQRGAGYLWYKILKRAFQDHEPLGRRTLYRNPRWYWEQRGGDDYFSEQESQPDRTTRCRYIARRVAELQPQSVLEIGCGYGKQLRAIQQQGVAHVAGVDWSSSQLSMARRYLANLDVPLARGDGAQIPFADNSFDLVLTSAVILHNPPDKACAIHREICRVARRYAVHNEDTNTSFSRFGYNTAQWYREQGMEVVEDCSIPGIADSAESQFCVVRLAESVANL